MVIYLDRPHHGGSPIERRNSTYPTALGRASDYKDLQQQQLPHKTKHPNLKHITTDKNKHLTQDYRDLFIQLQLTLLVLPTEQSNNRWMELETLHKNLKALHLERRRQRLLSISVGIVMFTVVTLILQRVYPYRIFSIKIKWSKNCLDHWAYQALWNSKSSGTLTQQFMAFI